MADISDVETALVDLIAMIAYPQGTAYPSIFGAETFIFRGWPTKQNLDPALKEGHVTISVYSLPGFSRDISRYRQAWKTAAVTEPTITVTHTEMAATFAGVPGIKQTAGIVYGDNIYSVAVSPADTPATVAAALAAVVPGATLSGVTVTMASYDRGFQAGTGGYGTAVRELAREVQGMRVSIWSPTVELRDLVAKTLRSAIAGVDFLTFPEGSSGRIQHVGGFVDDKPSKGNLWLRDLRYTVEFPTTQTITAPRMVFANIKATMPSGFPPDVQLFNETTS